MTTELDHQAIIERIIAILEADTAAIFGDQKIPVIEYGVSSEDQPEPYPHCHVTFESETDQPLEGMTGNVATSSYHVVRYVIVVVDAANTGGECEKILYGYHKAIKEQLKENPRLLDPTTLTDAKCIYSWPIRSRMIAPLEERGDFVGGFILTLEAKMSTN